MLAMPTIPLPVRILGGPVLAFVALFLVWKLAGGLWKEPAITIVVLACVALAWLRVLWPAGFRSRA